MAFILICTHEPTLVGKNKVIILGGVEHRG